MLKNLAKVFFCGVLCGSLLILDYVLGSGFVDILERNYCKMFCFIKKTLKNQVNMSEVVPPTPSDLNISMLIIEMTALFFTMLILNKCKKCILRPYTKEQYTEDMYFNKPIQQRAVITTSSQSEGGDNDDNYDVIGDSIDKRDCSFFDKQFNLVDDNEDCDCLDMNKTFKMPAGNNRYLWDVIEEN